MIVENSQFLVKDRAKYANFGEMLCEKPRILLKGCEKNANSVKRSRIKREFRQKGAEKKEKNHQKSVRL